MRSPAFLTALVLGLSALTAAFSSPNNIEERLIKEKRDGGLGGTTPPKAITTFLDLTLDQQLSALLADTLRC
ncbi:uncharacterized protein RSE6_01879 [Rhynchosporium secalis]|uniref:Uncharacterized protein n=1 Tax=Rhynchosporium secalis TaxID=38038 RepID=A0A1E1LYV3_RHYSE|nr:uncharacterized protein RSE6_01879 [Rhynchosporium secalis]